MDQSVEVSLQSSKSSKHKKNLGIFFLTTTRGFALRTSGFSLGHKTDVAQKKQKWKRSNLSTSHFQLFH